MKIKDRYCEKELQIRIQSSSNRTAKMWIEFGCNPEKETLSYLNIEELLDLKKEIQKALNEIIKQDSEFEE